MPARLVLSTIAILSLSACTSWHGEKTEQDRSGLPALDLPQDVSSYGMATRAIDGDTIVFLSKSQKGTIRLCGIDAPELDQPGGTESKVYLEQLLTSVNEEIVVVPSGRDRHGRIVGEIFISANNPQQPDEERLVGYELVRSGMAYNYERNSDDCPNGGRYYAQAQQEAEQEGLGVWSTPEAVKPWDWQNSKN